MDALIYLGILFVGLLPGLYMLAQYNSLIALRNCIRESWSDIDTELKRRYDLIPRLVEVARGYATHERELFERVTELRDRCAANQGSVKSQSGDEAALVSGLQTLFARVEAYPELKADEQFLNLQRELVNTEDRIQASRRFYNGNVRDYLNKSQSFPSSIVAQMFGFRPISYFEVEPVVRQTPKIS
ncbi:MAG TPA: LemA family protein [Chthoniobacterales bacterium]|nr:LemA family protein [Chthoniobacterales bacterium]